VRPAPLDEALSITRLIASRSTSRTTGAYTWTSSRRTSCFTRVSRCGGLWNRLAVSSRAGAPHPDRPLPRHTGVHEPDRPPRIPSSMGDRSVQPGIVLYEMLGVSRPTPGRRAGDHRKRLSRAIPHLSTLRQVPSAVELATCGSLQVPCRPLPHDGEFASALALADRRPAEHVALAVGALAC